MRCRVLHLVAPILAALLSPAYAPAQSPVPARSSIPVGSKWAGARPGQVTISDDGRRVFYQANRGDGWRMFVHEFGQAGSREIPGLGDTPYFPDISPDGKSLLFGKKGWVWKTPIDGGPLSLVYSVNNFKAMETDDTFIVSKQTGGFWRVRADGSRKDERIAPVDTASGATTYARPSMLPGGRGILTSVGFNTGFDLRKIGIVSLPSGKLTVLDEYGINPRYSASGHILYTQGNTLKAIRFDLDRLQPQGQGVTVVEGVEVYPNQASQFDISANGVLVYVTGPSELNRVYPRTLVWVDRAGYETPFDSPAEKLYGAVRLSPNGRYLAAEVGAGLHLYDRQSGAWAVLSEAGAAGAPVWARNSQSLYYSRAGVLGRQSVQPAGLWTEVWRSDRQFWGYALTRDSSQLLGTDWITSSGLWHLSTIALGAKATSVPLLESGDAIRRNPALSPDGNWVAYVEKTAGLDNVYVQPFPAGGKPLLVSKDASGEASEPAWGQSAGELFYRDGARMVAVQLETSPTLRIKRTTPLFSVRRYYGYLNSFATVHAYDAATDRFLMVRNVIQELPGTDIQVIRNGFDVLNRLAPRK
ncbi:MAG: hypothetical protein ABMA00_04780 [Gemmatimonas sp.]